MADYKKHVPLLHSSRRR